MRSEGSHHQGSRQKFLTVRSGVFCDLPVLAQLWFCLDVAQRGLNVRRTQSSTL